MSMDNPIKEGYISSAGALHATAKRAYHRAAQEGNHPTETEDNSLAAVLLACATLEAYINETFMLIHEMPQLLAESERARTFTDILHEIEDSRGSTRLKYLMGLATLTGKPFRKGDYPYQDFEILFSIRDELMHHKLEKISDEPHRIVKKLRSKGVCAEDNGVRRSWHGLVFTPATAKWACNTAADMINTIQAALFAAADQEKMVTPLKFLAGMNYTRIE